MVIILYWGASVSFAPISLVEKVWSGLLLLFIGISHCNLHIWTYMYIWSGLSLFSTASDEYLWYSSSHRWEGVVRIRDTTRKSLIEFRGPVFPIDVTGQDVGIPSFFIWTFPFHFSAWFSKSQMWYNICTRSCSTENAWPWATDRCSFLFSYFLDSIWRQTLGQDAKVQSSSSRSLIRLRWCWVRMDWETTRELEGSTRRSSFLTMCAWLREMPSHEIYFEHILSALSVSWGSEIN